MKFWNFRLAVIASLMMVAAAAWSGNNDTVWSKYSCGFPMVIFQQSTQSFLTTD